MFTGIVETVGRVVEVVDSGGDKRLCIEAGALDLDAVKLGDSIATNGICLTVTDLAGSRFWADVSRETLSVSTLSGAEPGQPVNLERAMPADGRFDGHIVSGHVDGIGKVLARRPDGRSTRLEIAVPEVLRRYTAVKGSICIDGVSLTINALSAQGVVLNIVPHTAAQTVIEGYAPGIPVNIEVDVIARYLEQLLAGEGANGSPIDEAFLAEHGFLRRGR